jgi:proteasome accessory factor B
MKAPQGVARPAIERLHRIHRLLQENRYPNSTKLAREFEVCARTIKRDIEFMKDRLGLPVDYNVNRNGYYYTRPVEQFPQMPLSESEVFALLVAQKAVAQYQGTPFEQPLTQAFQRLTGRLDKTTAFSLDRIDEAVSFRPFAPGDADLNTFEVLTTALKERRSLRFVYRNRGETTRARRHTLPYHLACVQNQWYLLAFDTQRKGMRTFALSRIESPRTESDRFELPADFDLKTYLAGSFGVYKGSEDYEVVIQFDAWAADEVRGRRWHSTQEIVELPKGALELRVRLNNLEEVEKWILSMGTHATVVKPEALRERIRKISASLAARYSQ